MRLSELGMSKCFVKKEDVLVVANGGAPEGLKSPGLQVYQKMSATWSRDHDSIYSGRQGFTLVSSEGYVEYLQDDTEIVRCGV